MARIKRSEAYKVVLDFFTEKGKVYLRSEYAKLGDEAPIPYRMFARYFGGNPYNTVCKQISKKYPVEWAAIGSKMVEEEPKPKPVFSKKTKESDLTPLEKLRMTSGDSYE